MFCSNGSRLIVWFTLFCFVTTQTAAIAGPHDEGTAAGQAANPVIRGTVNTPSATANVPGYTTTPPERAYYGQPDLAAQGNARLTLCATMPNDPVCQAQRGALNSANTPRPAIGANDPAVAAARGITRSPSSVLDDLASYYSGCTTSTTSLPATTQARTCLRYQGVGNYSCSRTLSVAIARSTNCTPGDWFAHAGSGSAGLDAQCVPDRPDTAQHFRVTQGGSPLSFFDVDMTTPVVFPEMVAVLGTSYSGMTGLPIRTGVWVADKSCAGTTCSLTAMIAAESQETCTGSGDSGYTCTTVEPFLKRYAACRAGTQSGDNIQDSVCSGDSGCTTTVLDGTKCYAPSGGRTPYTGIDITGTVPGNYWNIDADRAVVGWDVNPAFGPIPTMRLSYLKALTSVAATDRWDDQCPALVAGGRCTVNTAAICADGPGAKVVDGVTVTRDCWQYDSTMSCSSAAPADQCAPLAASGCTPTASACKQANAVSGLCEVYEDTYTCAVPAQTVTSGSNCPSNVFCLQGNCFDISHTNDADFARSMSMLEAAREAGVYLDTNRMQVFKGEANSCRDRLLKNCCYSDGAGAGMTNQSLFGTGSRLVYDVLMNSENREFLYQGMSALLTSGGFSGSFTSYGVTVAVNGTALPAGSSVLYAGDSLVVAFDPWSLVIAIIIYIILSMMSCNEEEGKLAMKEGAGLCHGVGTWCSSCFRVLGVCVSCVEHRTGKCCFNSKLARIVNEQGRVQVGKGWGSGENPDCSGFTIAQLQSLNFAAMDLTEFYASIVPTLPNLGAIQTGNSGKVPNCYYGQGRCQ
ncbi:type-F conjugative transfer system mating-pair stabilization protein TraN [Sphaerotilus sp.]|uniref:type-F conjugative transfer system mating-pair stabilization protein TraN n=1 Tax=Sphaerotilus sp. TaxID=2093942 RepID=UPI002ACEA4A9|nr:type-F conjugative transfer system mating-pair stabilization protein TraN [Sphaerotilus sp.]MDZ7855326.1 type-F conjugative transfer system mating-pair stabilization protein TraN [Sphaerotilus sp.]